MADTKTIFSDKKYPSFIKSHKVFKNFKEINKVFPQLGLPNCEKEIEIDNKKEAMQAAKNLISVFRDTIDGRFSAVRKFSGKNTLSKKRVEKLSNIILLLHEVKKQLIGTKCMTTNNGRVSIGLSADILDANNKIVFRSGESIFRVYNKLNELLREKKLLAMNKFETFQAFKDFSTKNVPSLKYKIKLSSEGNEGAWDIATMSMRGITSCQSWNGGGGHSSHVVGSIVDPFTAIIYLTSGTKFNEYGSKMIRRCVVRFMVDGKTKTPFLGLERMYPSYEKSAINSFITFLKEKSEHKLDVLYIGPESPKNRKNIYNCYVPLSKIVQSLPQQHYPYRDSTVVYKDIEDISLKKLSTIERNNLENVFCDKLANQTMIAMRSIKKTLFPESDKDLLTRIVDRNNYQCFDFIDSMYFTYVSIFDKLGNLNFQNKMNKIMENIPQLIKELLSKAFMINNYSDKWKKSSQNLKDKLVDVISVKTKMIIEKELIKLEKLKEVSKIEHPVVPIYSKFLN